MRKEEFLDKLDCLLSDLPEDERQEAMEYYRDYLEEAGPGHEEEVTSHFGSPEKVAAEIRAGLAGNEESGEFTERGYQDERFREDYHVPDQYAEVVVSDSAKKTHDEADREDSFKNSDRENGRNYQREWSEWRKEREQRYQRDKREQQEQQTRDAQRQSSPRWWEYKGPRRQEDGTWSGGYDRQYDGNESRNVARREKNSVRFLIFLALFFFVGLPIIGSLLGTGVSVIAAIFGGIVGIFGGIIGLVIAAFAAAFGILVSGIGMIGSGIAHMAAPAAGLMMIGGGFLLLAVSMLVLILARWGCGVVIPWAVRLIRDIVRSICRWAARCFRKLTGSRGDQV